jgi:Arc/MetJ-type ribon-helix-helix transcriptional regulator
MKVIALKIWKKQDKLMRVLVEAGLYSSLSECLRTATWAYFQRLFGTNGINVELGQNPSEYEKQFSGATVSITAKFPISMVTKIDLVVSRSNFKNRSDFFRAALIDFLIVDSQLFSPYLLENQN